MTTIRAAVIGCGAIAAQHLPPIAERDDSVVVGVCDRSPITVEYFAEEYQTAGFMDAAEMLASTRPNVVHILTPASSHVPLAELAIDHGAHVVVEKPAAANAAGLDHLIRRADEAGVTLIESQNYRFNDGFQQLVAAVAAGDIGELAEVVVTIRLDLDGSPLTDPSGPAPMGGLTGGAPRDFLSHLCGLGVAIGGRPRDVTARWWSPDPVHPGSFLDVDASGLTAEGVLSRVRFSGTSGPDQFRVTAIGRSGSITAELFQPFVWTESPTGPAVVAPLLNQAQSGIGLVKSSVNGLRSKVMRHTPYHGLHRMIDAFYDHVAKGSPSPLSTQTMLDTAHFVDDIVAAVPDQGGSDQTRSSQEAAS